MFDTPQYSCHHLANAVVHPVHGHIMEYRELIKDPLTKGVWLKSSANEFGRLAQGVGGRISGTNTIKFIGHKQVPRGRTVTYARFVCELRPMKAEVERTRITVGGNLINYPGRVSTNTADITTAKCLWNSTISKKHAKFMCDDVKNFYLNTPMDRPEYMKIPIDLIPPEIIIEYKLLDLVHEGYVYIEINKGMYGLPQAGLLANKLLGKRLAKYGYYQSRHTPGLWKHAWRPIQFVLVVDDFGVEYVGREHAEHLINALCTHYEAVSTDWEGSLYCGITLKWDYHNRTVTLSMPNYVRKALHKFEHQQPKRPQHAPHKHNIPQYGVAIQLTEPLDQTKPLSKERRNRIQQIVGTFLYYARAVDPTMLVSLSTLSSKQSRATKATEQAVHQFLDYAATHPNAAIQYRSSGMALIVHSDAGYLNAPSARSRIGGHFYLSQSNNPRQPNGSILNPTGILRHVASSASEAELGALFVNCKEAAILRTTLHKMGYPQDNILVFTDNTTAHGIANDTIKQQRSRAIDMRYHWVRDQVDQQRFTVKWLPSKQNWADYYTKHHTPKHHQNLRSFYLHKPHTISNRQNCNN